MKGFSSEAQAVPSFAKPSALETVQTRVRPQNGWHCATIVARNQYL